MTEVAPQEAELRAQLKKSERKRMMLMNAGFRTCTANGMLCRQAGDLKQADGRDVLYCETRKAWIIQDTADSCTKERLQPL